MTIGRWRTAQFNILPYQVSSPSNVFSIGVKKSLNSFDGFFCKRSNWEQSMGVNDKAATVEINMMAHIIQPSCLKSTPDIPLTIVNGKNTAIMVKVEAITEIATSLVPCTAACFGSEPRSIWVVTFSSTTIASSTTIPIAMESDESEIILIVFPLIAR